MNSKRTRFSQLWFLLPALIMLFGLGRGYAQVNDPFYYVVLPTQSSIEVNEETLENPSATTAQLMFLNGEELEILVDAETAGVRMMSNSFTVDIKQETHLQITEVMRLEAGSVHISSAEDATQETLIRVGNLDIRFQSADFIAFRSGEGDQNVIKVISGEVTIDSPETQQQAVLVEQEATNTDEDGRLLIPFPVSVKASQGWWNSKEYQQKYSEPPLADAGQDQRVLTNMTVTLDGSASEFDTGDVFEWKLVSGPKDSTGKPIEKVAFNTINIVKPQFTPKDKGEYLFSLQITSQNGQKSNISSVTISVGREFLEPAAIFPDVPKEHPNNLAITYLYKKNVMRGSQDPETGEVLFRPEDTINRVEILKTLFENLQEDIPSQEELEALEDEIFIDVKASHWFAPYVQLAKERGIVKGNDGLYRPADEVLLVEALKIIAESNEISIDAYQQEKGKPYVDAEAEAWYNPYLFFVKKYTLFDPDSDGKIQPGRQLTRAEFAEIIYRMESVNLREKRGFIDGQVLNKETQAAIVDAEILIYKAIEESTDEEGGFFSKGDLYLKIDADEKGRFTISLPVHSKFYIEAVTEENVSANKVIVEVIEDQTKEIELQVEEN